MMCEAVERARPREAGGETEGKGKGKGGKEVGRRGRPGVHWGARIFHPLLLLKSDSIGPLAARYNQGVGSLNLTCIYIDYLCVLIGMQMSTRLMMEGLRGKKLVKFPLHGCFSSKLLFILVIS